MSEYPIDTLLILGNFIEVFETCYRSVTRIDRVIAPTDRIQDLRIDSLHLMEILVALEEHYRIRLVEHEEVARVETVSDLHHLVSRQLDREAETA
ncbi:acyl carrier protein [Micromonospora sp. NPDC000089]|uniref:acyl carrier protein n=1 Tax=unclassified Micromonospora TaxID=2617518 RepID=UPI0036D1E557